MRGFEWKEGSIEELEMGGRADFKGIVQVWRRKGREERKIKNGTMTVSGRLIQT